MLMQNVKTPKLDLKSEAPSARAMEFMHYPENVDYALEWIADGKPLHTLAEALSASYSKLYAELQGRYTDSYRAAKAAAMERLAERNLEMAERTELGEVAPLVAKTVAGIRQWHMERQSPKEYGQKSTTDVNIKGTVGLYMEAIRSLTNQPIEQEAIDAEYEEIEQERDDEDLPGSELL